MPAMVRSLALFGLVAAVACASTQATTPPAAHPATPQSTSAPPPPPVPQDPLDLVASDVALFASARVQVMRDKESFATLRRAVVRYGCISEADLDWIAGQTERALFAGRGDSDLPEFLVILAGQYAEEDAGRVLETLAGRVGTTDPLGARTQGRFSITQKGPWSAVVLEGRLLVAGHDGFVGSTLASIEAPPETRYAQTPTFRELGERMQCIERSVCGLITPDGAVARRMKGELAGIGIKKVGRSLASGQTGVSIAVGEGMNLSVVAHLGTQDEAQALAKDTKDWLWQAGLVARLAGFPDVLRDAEVHNDGRFTELKIRVQEGDLDRLEQRLTQLLRDEPAAQCPQPVAAGAAPARELFAATQQP